MMINRDILIFCKIVALTLIAWLLPPRFWRKAAMSTAWIGRNDPCWPAYRHVLGSKYADSEIARISARRRSYTRELQLEILGLNCPWWSWRPDICLKGIDHLQRALANEHGAILWVTETSFSTLIVKMALHNAGYRTCQLSRPGHGFSPFSFGARVFNPIWTGVEDRFIAERILIIGEHSADVMSVLREKLAANRIVSITVVPLARKFAEVPFFQDQLQLPTGPIRLAMATGAALLSVFAVTKGNGEYEVSIEEPLYPTRNHANIECIAATYAERLETFVLEYPDQWSGWHWLQSRIRPRGQPCNCTQTVSETPAD